jgi:hypothetical protein
MQVQWILLIGYTNYKNQHAERRITNPRIRYTRRAEFYGPSYRWFLLANTQDRAGEERAFLLSRITSVTLKLQLR